MSVSDKALRQRAYADRLIAEKQEDLASMHPTAPLASKMFRNNTGLIADHKRGAMSPLGGQAAITRPRARGR
jgi:hypothetical protein